MFYSGIFLDELKNTTKKTENNQSLSRDSHPALPEYEAEILTARSGRLVYIKTLLSNGTKTQQT
jgi:hypothetical protein